MLRLFILAILLMAFPAKAECPDVQLRLVPSYEAEYDEAGNVTQRLLRYLVKRHEDDNNTFVYTTCLVYHEPPEIPWVVVPIPPPCIMTTMDEAQGAVVPFDVIAGYRFDVRTTVMVDGEAVTSDPSSCAIVTGVSDTNGDGVTGGPDFQNLIAEIGREMIGRALFYDLNLVLFKKKIGNMVTI